MCMNGILILFVSVYCDDDRGYVIDILICMPYFCQYFAVRGEGKRKNCRTQDKEFGTRKSTQDKNLSLFMPCLNQITAIFRPAYCDVVVVAAFIASNRLVSRACLYLIKRR